MSYEVLARKWRPKRFADLIGQDHVVKALKGALKTDQVGHAYLLTGTRGVGKTSLARILAKALNCENLTGDCEPCLTCKNCLSIDSGNSLNYQEIDGASHNGVEHIRGLIENLQYLPTQGKYKLYVIDEVHMLSTSAFNALLKTLEEPPAHVVFIFATTDPEKLLKTVISRCQRFDLRSISLLVLKEHVANILKEEGIEVESEQVLSLICQAGKGSVRDTLTLLEQLKNFSDSKRITEESLFYGLGFVKLTAVEKICRAVLEKKVNELTQIYKECLKENVDINSLANQILDYFYNYTQKLIREERDSVSMINTYESLNKDFGLSLESLNPERMILINLQKHALGASQRRMASTKPAARPQQQQKQSIAPQKIVEKAKPQGFQFESFLNYLKGKRPASAANLELGNLIKASLQNTEFCFGFKEESRLFYDYFQEKDVLDGLKQEIANFIRRDKSEIKLSFVLLSIEEAEEKSFQSIAEIEGKKRSRNTQDMKTQFKNQSMIKEAEKIFGKPVQDIQVKESR